MVTMIDDRAEVWDGAPNLITVKPYTFFDGTADINAPPGAEQSNVCPMSVDRRVNTTKRRARVVRVPVLDAGKNYKDMEQGGDSELKKSSGIKHYKEMVEWEDSDNHLINLENILLRVDAAYYEDLAPGEIPDLRRIIPVVRRKVLSGVNILFSGIFVDSESPETVWATSLGATIQMKFVQPGTDASTTHVVAGRPDTEKVYRASKHPTVHIVTPQWLQVCSERWERVSKRIYSMEYLHPGKIDKTLKPMNDPESHPKENATEENKKKENVEPQFPRKRELPEDKSGNRSSEVVNIEHSKRTKLNGDNSYC